MVKGKNQKTNMLCKPRVLASGTQSQFNNLKMNIVLLTRTGLEISVHLIQKVRKQIYTFSSDELNRNYIYFYQILKTKNEKQRLKLNESNSC